MGIFRKLEKTIVIFGISTLEFAEMQKSFSKQKNIEFGTKMPYSGILGCKLV